MKLRRSTFFDVLAISATRSSKIRAFTECTERPLAERSAQTTEGVTAANKDVGDIPRSCCCCCGRCCLSVVGAKEDERTVQGLLQWKQSNKTKRGEVRWLEGGLCGPCISGKGSVTRRRCSCVADLLLARQIMRDLHVSHLKTRAAIGSSHFRSNTLQKIVFTKFALVSHTLKSSSNVDQMRSKLETSNEISILR